MGQTKQSLERQNEYGYSSIDKRVCNHCVSDKDIRQFIKNKGEAFECDYCDKKSAKTVSFDELMEFILEHINDAYGWPDDDIVDDDNESIIDNNDLLFDLDVTEIDKLQDDILGSINDRVWYEYPDYQSTLSEALEYGWEEFVNIVKHKSRYAFYLFEEERYHSPISPREFLNSLSDVFAELELYKHLPKGTYLYRVRIHNIYDDKGKFLKLSKASELAPPNADQAIYPNRMSPAGIPMFYGAYDIATCIKETYSFKEEQIATVAKFKLLKDITLVDLSKLPPLLGFFAAPNRYHHQIDFLNGFVRDVAKEIEKDGREHIEYVPTQIITEHLRYVHHRQHDVKRIDGLIYPSSKNKGKNSVVVFCENEHCVEKGQADNNSLFELQYLKRVNPNLYFK